MNLSSKSNKYYTSQQPSLKANQMSNTEQQSDDKNNVRKSKRQRVPNSYYTTGINQNKKTNSNANNNPRSTRKGRQQQQDQDYYSEGLGVGGGYDERNNVSSNNRYQQSGPSYSQNRNNNNKGTFKNSNVWLPCVLPNKKNIKVRVIVDSQEIINQPEIIKTAKQEIPIYQPQKQTASEQNNFISFNSATSNKKNQPSSLNLLSLFEQAIKNVQGQNQPVTNKKAENTVQKIPQQSAQKAISKQTVPLSLPPKRTVEEDKDGKMTSYQIDRDQKIVRINHTRLGIYQIPLQKQAIQSKLKIQSENNQQDQDRYQQLKLKLEQNAALLKGITIFN